MRLHVLKHHDGWKKRDLQDIFEVNFLAKLTSKMGDIHVEEDKWQGRLGPNMNIQNMVTKKFKR